MSLPNEKFRSIFRMREVLAGILWSKKCKIPEPWYTEIRYAIKHCPSPYDVTVEGKSFESESMDIEGFAAWISDMDKKASAKK